MDKNITQSLNEIINAFNQEIILNQDITDSYFTRGILKFCIDDVNGAATDWALAVKMGSRKPIFLINYLTLTYNRN